MHGYKERKIKNFFVKFTFVLLIILVIALTYYMYQKTEVAEENTQNNTYVSKLSQTVKIQEENESNITTMLEQVSKCVVGISKLQDKGQTIFMQNSEASLGLGTGMLISEKGYILTNQHVVGNKYSKCYVTLDTGNEYTADVIWADSGLDLAIIKINATVMNKVTLGDSDNIKVGEEVYAIGNPIGFEFRRTVTSGIISALDRTIKIDEQTYMADLIQTDATINQGSSGGPLITKTGEVIGITSVKITSAEAIGFAIPINVVKPIIERIVNGEQYVQATLGIFAYDKNVIPYLDSNLKIENGIYVAQVNLDGPANNMLKEGDIITKIDAVVLNKMNDLRKYIFTKNPGDIVILTVMRNKKEIQMEMKLGTSH